MSRKFPVLLILLSAMMLAVSCGDPDAPKDLIEEDQYVKIFAELVVLNQLTDDQLGPVSREYLSDQIFEDYSVTEEQFDRSHKYYQRNPEQQLERVERVNEIITDERDRFQERLNRERERRSAESARSDTL